MEEKFYLDDFELSLKEHANQFKMVPSKKVWHGIYNDLHPGRRWPSFMVSLLLIFSIVFVGYINTQTDKIAVDSTPQTPATSVKSNAVVRGDVNNNEDVVSKKADQSRNEPGAVKQNKEVESIVAGAHKYSENKQLPRSDYSSKNSESIIDQELAINKYSTIENTAGVTTNNIQISMLNSEFKIPGLAIANEKINNIPTLTTTGTIGTEIFSIINSNQPDDDKDQLSGSENIVTAITRKRNDKISWMYYASPFLSSVSLRGQPLKEHNNPNLTIAAPLQQPALQQVSPKDVNVIHNPAFGFEAGAQMNYSLTPNLQLTAGAHLTHSGYNVVSNLVHPTLSTLVLRDPSTGNTYSRNFVTHYGDGTGMSTVSLKNYSYQTSLPVGLQYLLWNNDKFQVNLGANVEPSFIVKADAFILSSDGKNYLNVPDLLRKWNFSSNFAPFVSFRSDKFKWSIGPNIRYQWLSTYQKSYTVKEHLIDYGIRVGISK